MTKAENTDLEEALLRFCRNQYSPVSTLECDLNHPFNRKGWKYYCDGSACVRVPCDNPGIVNGNKKVDTLPWGATQTGYWVPWPDDTLDRYPMAGVSISGYYRQLVASLPRPKYRTEPLFFGRAIAFVAGDVEGIIMGTLVTC